MYISSELCSIPYKSASSFLHSEVACLYAKQKPKLFSCMFSPWTPDPCSAISFSPTVLWTIPFGYFVMVSLFLISEKCGFLLWNYCNFHVSIETINNLISVYFTNRGKNLCSLWGKKVLALVKYVKKKSADSLQIKFSLIVLVKIIFQISPFTLHAFF